MVGFSSIASCCEQHSHTFAHGARAVFNATFTSTDLILGGIYHFLYNKRNSIGRKITEWIKHKISLHLRFSERVAGYIHSTNITHSIWLGWFMLRTHFSKNSIVFHSHSLAKFKPNSVCFQLFSHKFNWSGSAIQFSCYFGRINSSCICHSRAFLLRTVGLCVKIWRFLLRILSADSFESDRYQRTPNTPTDTNKLMKALSVWNYWSYTRSPFIFVALFQCCCCGRRRRCHRCCCCCSALLLLQQWRSQRIKVATTQTNKSYIRSFAHRLIRRQMNEREAVPTTTPATTTNKQQ